MERHGIANKVNKKINLCKLRYLINCDSNDAMTILSDTIRYITTTTQQIEEVKRDIETMSNMQHVGHQPRSLEVKVEEQGMNQFLLKVRSTNEEGKNYSAIIMEVLEENGISFLNANVSRCLGFDMDAIIEVSQDMDSSFLTEVIIQAIEYDGST